MDDLDEVRQIAVAETQESLDASEKILLKTSIGPDEVDELFQKIHTAKSNLAVIPDSRLLSHLLQNLETVLAKIRSEGRGVPEKMIDPLLVGIEKSMKLLKQGSECQPPEFEKDLHRFVNGLRLTASKL